MWSKTDETVIARIKGLTEAGKNREEIRKILAREFMENTIKAEEEKTKKEKKQN